MNKMWLFVFTVMSCICFGFLLDVSSGNAEVIDNDLVKRINATLHVLADNNHKLLILVQTDRSDINDLIKRLNKTEDKMEKLIINEQSFNQTIQALQTLTTEQQRELNKEQSMSKKLTRNYNNLLFKVNREVDFLKKQNHDLERKINTTAEKMEDLMSEKETLSYNIETLQNITSQQQHELNKAKSESKRSRLSVRSSLTVLDNALQDLTNSTGVGFINLNGNVLNENKLLRDEMRKFEKKNKQRINKKLGNIVTYLELTTEELLTNLTLMSVKMEKDFKDVEELKADEAVLDSFMKIVMLNNTLIVSQLQMIKGDIMKTIRTRNRVTKLESSTNTLLPNLTGMSSKIDKNFKDLQELKSDAELSCRFEKFTCTKQFQCIPASKKCDGFVDCSDRTDEEGCGPGGPCRTGQYVCDDGLCARQGSGCNGRTECRDGSDEFPKYCGCPSLRQFQCRDGTKCIDAMQECDGIMDCTDRSDEHSRCVSTCRPDEFRCSDGSCINLVKQCDGVRDCVDNSDENNCPTLNCRADQFTCTQQFQCIPAARKCDGFADCSDRTDEEGCACKLNEFRCSNGQCIDNRRQCDRNRDCLDNSDEEGCAQLVQPSIRIEPTFQTVNEFETAEFRCIATGRPTPTVEWRRGTGTMNPSAVISGGVLKIPAALRSDEAQYFCQALNVAGSTRDRTILYVKSNPRPLTLIVRQVAIIATIGSTEQLICYIDDNSVRPTLIWSRNGGLPSGSRQDNGVLTLNNIQSSHAGSYVCSGKTPNGAMGKATATLTVRPEIEKNTRKAEELITQTQTPVKYNLPVSLALRQQLNIKKSTNENLYIRNCIKTGNTLVFTDWSKTRLIICNSDGTNKHHMSLSCNPSFITEIDSNTVAVSCVHDRIILIINISTRSVTSTINTSSYCWGISYNDNNLYVVIGDSVIMVIHVMDLSGKVIRTIPLPSDYIYDITVDRDRLICIDYASIYYCSLDGKVMWKFEKDEFQGLTRVTTDNEGNVYVINEWTHTVIVVSDDGKHHRQLLTESDGLDRPRGIYFDKKENTLLVCNFEDGKAFLFDVKKKLT